MIGLAKTIAVIAQEAQDFLESLVEAYERKDPEIAVLLTKSIFDKCIPLYLETVEELSSE